MNQRILFVDDEVPIRELLSMYFRKHGCTVTTAATSEEALSLVGQEPFDLAILDVNLAGQSGLELLGVLKAKKPAMPVVIFTGLGSDPALVEEARAKGADGFMNKTESLGSLLREVQRLLPQP